MKRRLGYLILTGLLILCISGCSTQSWEREVDGEIELEGYFELVEIADPEETRHRLILRPLGDDSGEEVAAKPGMGTDLREVEEGDLIWAGYTRDMPPGQITIYKFTLYKPVD